MLYQVFLDMKNTAYEAQLHTHLIYNRIALKWNIGVKKMSNKTIRHNLRQYERMVSLSEKRNDSHQVSM